MFYLLICFLNTIKDWLFELNRFRSILTCTGCFDYRYWYLMAETGLKCDHMKWASTRGEWGGVWQKWT